MFQTDAAGKFKSAMDCARASAIGGGCTLTQTAGQTAETGTYTRLAKEVGYACNVSSYKSFGQDTKTGREVVELACSDHPDGAFAMLPVNKGQAGEVFNCLRAEARQLKCTLTPASATYAKIGAEMAAKGKTCQVTNGRAVGLAPSGDDYVEVACSGVPRLHGPVRAGPGNGEGGHRLQGRQGHRRRLQARRLTAFVTSTRSEPAGSPGGLFSFRRRAGTPGTARAGPGWAQPAPRRA